MLGNLLKKRGPRTDYDEDFFKDSRMSFGDHLEELRWRMWRAIKGLGLCLIIGFILDNVGDQLGYKWLGIGKPMLRIITGPVEAQVKEFYRERTEKSQEKLDQARKENKDDKIKEMSYIPTKIKTKTFLDKFDGLKLKDPDQEEIEVDIAMAPADIEILKNKGEYVTDSRQFLTGLGVMEAFMVYIKVSLLCGVVIACPWIFWQMWSFIGAGLYPHEKKMIHIYLPFSVFLFLGGVLICQFIVMPKAVEAMLGFYRWIEIDPDLRLKEWLGFAIVMPLVFGVSFQTPLVMVFFNRIGVFTWELYLAKWRMAVMVLAVLAAVLTPSTDVISMLWLFIPTFGLYMAGVGICYLLGPPQMLLGPEIEEEEVGV